MRKPLATLVLGLAGVCAGAQAAPAWRLQDLLPHTIGSNPGLRRAASVTDSAEAEVLRSYGAFLPRLDLSASSQRLEKYGSIPGINTLLLGGRNQISAATSYMQATLNVFNGGADMYGVRIARAYARETSLQRVAEKQDVIERFLRRYHDAKLLAADHRLAKARLGLAEQQLQRCARDLGMGRAPRIRCDELEIERDLRRIDAATLLDKLAGSTRSLLSDAGLHGAAATADERVIDGEAESYTQVLENLGVARGGRIGAEIAQLQTKRIELERGKIYGRFMPRIDLFARTEYGSISEQSVRHTLGIQKRDKHSFGVLLQWNLFEGFESYHTIKARAHDIEAARHAVDAAREGARQRLDDLDLTMRARQADLDSAQARLRLQEKKLALAEVEFGAGRRSLDDIEDARLDIELRRADLVKLGQDLHLVEALALLREVR
jgi:outer membrane protein TolC